MYRCIALFLASIVLTGFTFQDAGTKELAKLEGVWKFALVEVDGIPQPEMPVATNKMIITRDGKYVIVQGSRITRGFLEVDPTQSPKHYDVTVTSGPAKGLKASGIYEIEGDSYKICLPLRGMARPTTLVSKPGSGYLHHVFKKEKEDVGAALVQVARQELAGTWQAVAYSLDGNKASDEDMKKIQLVIDAAGKATALREGKPFIISTVTADPTQSPMTMDVTFVEGESKGQTSLGIYKIEEDVLTICRAPVGKPRPTEYSSSPGSGLTLMSYRRGKPSGT